MDSELMADERNIVSQVEQTLSNLGPFVSLSEAAQQLNIPLSTLAEAVRTRRVPAVRVQKRRWLVRLSAVKLYFGQDSTDPEAAQHRLLEAGLIAEIKPRQTRTLTAFDPAPFSGDMPASMSLIADRR